MSRPWLETLAWIGFLGWSSQAWSGAFSVTPLRIFMTPRDRAVAVTIMNESDNPLRLQADLMQWQQDAQGQDLLEATDDLVLSPPIIELGPHARQVIRLARLVPPDPQRQLSYRLLVQEMPETTSDKAQGLQIPISLALSMPVFITPPGVHHGLQCQLATLVPSRTRLSCQNTGSAHAQLREVTVSQQGRVLGRYSGSSYILPGAHKDVPITFMQGPPSDGPVRVEWLFNDSQRDQLNAVWP
ncbi:MAG: molecular chaperone [Limnohabitans sp.]